MEIKVYCQRIKALRESNEYTQSFVADYLKIDRSNYSKYELGKLDLKPDMIIALAKLYEVSTDYILGLVDFY